MTEIITKLFYSLAETLGSHMAVIIISFLPLGEARLALPLSISYGLKPVVGLILSYIGSCLPAIIILPLLKVIFKGKESIKDRLNNSSFGKKAAKLKSKALKAELTQDKDESVFFDPDTLKALVCLGGFVALPLPLTGVWSGVLIAALLGGKTIRAMLSVCIGNLIACVLLLIMSVLLTPYINIIVTVITLAAIAAVIATLIKTIISITKKNS